MIAVAAEHIPVLVGEVLELLRVRPGGVYVDCTLGLAGHSLPILERLEGKGRLIGLEWDGQALERARERLSGYGEQAELFREDFKNLPALLADLEITALNGCLVDLGVGSHQLDSPERGFSFSSEGPLDMRMDLRQEVTAADLLNRLPEEELAEIFRDYGEEKAARRFAREIVARRKRSPFQSTADLVGLVQEVRGARHGRIHPATQLFQALRIKVNRELEGLEPFLEKVISLLAPAGRLVVISFHSLEDRIVKTVFRKAGGRCVCFRPVHLCTCPRKARVRLLTRKPVRPSEQEIRNNPRSRSAKLRAVEKLEVAGGVRAEGPVGPSPFKREKGD